MSGFCNIFEGVLLYAEPSGRVVQDMGLRTLASCNYGFESRRAVCLTVIVKPRQ